MALVIAHRTAAALAPENSLRGIEQAALCHANWVEMDVRLSRDGELILMHDERVDRTSSGCGPVGETSLEELKDLHLRNRDGSLDQSSTVPTLQEAVSLARELGLGLVVEMKEEGLEGLLAESISGEDCMVTSFYHASLCELSEISSLKTGIIISALPIYPLRLALEAGASAIFPRRVNARLFKEAHQQGLAVYPWTVNSQEEAGWMLRLGADGLVTDDPCLLRVTADQPAQATGRDNCPYYPCHHLPEQDCTHCFCPLYPCKDDELGSYV
ncbi:MAG TPA: glycerophosphodiester phosphodiesterase family protein, partial [Methanothrix sp.]|nr:glycerophosphodiester phosphodiesterase family protein [Methanothrix sp.]